MSLSGIALTLLISLPSCGDNTAGKDKTVVSPVKTTEVSFTNGVTDANKGMRKGPVELKGNIQFPQAGKIYLWSTYGKVNTLIDSAAVNGGQWSFGTKDIEQGIYMIGLAENNMTSIILNPSEKTTEIGFRTGRMEGSVYAVQSKENEAWFAYLPKENTLLKAIRDARVAQAKSSIKGEYEKQITQKEAELAQLQADMIGRYPDTHFAKVVTWKQEPNKTDMARYWDNIDFSDRSLIHGTVMSDRIQNFMRGFSQGTESGFINCVAAVAEKGKADDIVLEFVLNQMLVGFYESGMENICTFIIDNYINGDACGDADLSNIIKSTAESIQKLSVGHTPPNIAMAGIDGKQVDLMKIAASKKYTLVMFWSSWCEHCQGEAPEVKQCYDQFSPKGFEIVGVSVDNVRSAWEQAVRDRGFTFPNVCGMKVWESKAAKDYRITKTPGFYLLDAEGKIVMKPKGIREVKTFLTQNLK